MFLVIIFFRVILQCFFDLDFYAFEVYEVNSFVKYHLICVVWCFPVVNIYSVFLARMLLNGCWVLLKALFQEIYYVGTYQYCWWQLWLLWFKWIVWFLHDEQLIFLINQKLWDSVNSLFLIILLLTVLTQIDYFIIPSYHSFFSY